MNKVECYHIKKGTVTNIVDYDMFWKIYKPAGWEIDTRFHPQEEDKHQKALEQAVKVKELKEYNKMKAEKTRKKKFDDGILKGK